MNWDWKKWIVAALVRALKTFAQTFASMIVVGATFDEIDWMRALSVSGVAFILSILTSLAGLPEVPSLEEKPPAEDHGDAKFVPMLQGRNF